MSQNTLDECVPCNNMVFPSQCYHTSVSIFVEESGWTEEDGNKLQLAEFVSKILKVKR